MIMHVFYSIGNHRATARQLDSPVLPCSLLVVRPDEFVSQSCGAIDAPLVDKHVRRKVRLLILENDPRSGLGLPVIGSLSRAVIQSRGVVRS